MVKKYFTNEQMENLRNNPYVVRVSEKSITYTEEFKEEFYRQYLMGKTPSAVLREMGFDTQVLGKDRVDNIPKRLKKMANRVDGFTDTRKFNSGQSRVPKEMSLEEELSYLKHQLAYKNQEIEVLKKMNFINQNAHREQLKKNSKLSKK